MTKEAGFLETIGTDSKVKSNTTTSSNKAEVKSEPSLFDSMLSGIKNNNEDSTAQEQNKFQQNRVDVSKTTQTSNKDEIPLKANKNDALSFFDKITQEAAKAIQTEAQANGAEVDKILTKSQSSTENINHQEVKTTKATQANNTEVDKILAKNQSATENVGQQEVKTANVTQANNTEVDKILAKNQSATENVGQQEVKTANVTQATVQVDDTEVVKKDATNQSITQNVTAEENENNVQKATTQQSDAATDNKTQEDTKSQNATSLLDKLIKEAQTSIENEETNKAQNQTKQNGETELSVKTVNTQDKSSENITKETAPSLLDKLLKEANAQIQSETEKSTVQNSKSSEVEAIKTTQVKEVESKVVTTSQGQQTTVQTKEVVTKEIAQNGEKVTTVQTQVVKENVVANNTNENVAKELAKVQENSPEKINLAKNEIITNKVQNEKEPPKSLMDRLIEETKINKTVQESVVNTKLTSETNNGKMPTETLLNNIYLSSVNKASQDAFFEKTHEVKTLVANASSLKEVQKGADLLNLGLKSSEVTVEEAQFKENVKNEFLNKLSVTRDIIKHDITKMSEEIVAQSKTVKSEAAAALSNNLLNSTKLPEVEVTVSPTAAYNIENRIIGARQHMNSMMSDMARNMYLNYKPPVTAFRMNLNPGQLGSIAVLIKNDKESGLSISLNMSNVATLDSFVDNQAALRAALAKNFNANANINLEFNMQNSDQQGSGGQHNQQQQNHRATNDILESLNNNSEANEKVTNYM